MIYIIYHNQRDGLGSASRVELLKDLQHMMILGRCGRKAIEPVVGKLSTWVRPGTSLRTLTSLPKDWQQKGHNYDRSILQDGPWAEEPWCISVVFRFAPVNDLQNAHTRKLTASASLQQDASANLEFTWKKFIRGKNIVYIHVLHSSIYCKSHIKYCHTSKDNWPQYEHCRYAIHSL